jgi:ribosomal RNA-processing protein 9
VDESQLVYNGYSGSIDCVKFINEEIFLSCSDDGTLCVWNVGKKRPIAQKKVAHGKSPSGVANWISAIATLTNTDLIASGSCDGFIRVWKLEKSFREIKLKFEIPVTGFVNSLMFTNDGSSLIAGMGPEHRLGRWWLLKEAKSIIIVFPFQKKEQNVEK